MKNLHIFTPAMGSHPGNSEGCLKKELQGYLEIKESMCLWKNFLRRVKGNERRRNETNLLSSIKNFIIRTLTVLLLDGKPENNFAKSQ